MSGNTRIWAILTTLAGLSDAEVDRLERDGVLSSRVPAPGA